MKDSMRQTALIVEDDPGTRHVLSSTLATAGIDSIHAATGAVMWQQLDHAPDIIILDLSLPDGEVYVSEFGINHEDAAQEAAVPVFNMASPVVQGGQLRGVVVVRVAEMCLLILVAI